MIVTLIWLISIVVAAIIANEKKQSVLLYSILAFVTGPLAVIILLIVVSQKPNVQNSAKNSQGTFAIEDIRQELIQLRSSVKMIQERINYLEMRIPAVVDTHEIKEIKVADLFVAPLAEDKSLLKTAVANESVQRPDAVKSFDMEMYFGRNWLSKIGIVVFTLGMVFLISYSFKYFGAAAKILFGYVVSALFFFGGKKLEENKKFINFGRVIWGGGWAIAYFTTYAMYHFPASRLMDNPYWNMTLLAILVVGLLSYVLRYRNEEMMAIALFTAYVAATMGQVTNFTLLSCMFLAVVVLFFVYRFEWIKTLALGIVLTYAIHQIWVVPNIALSGVQILWWSVKSTEFAQLLNLSFLSIYALLFLAATHIAKTDKDADIENTLGAINFGNIVFYSIFAYSLVSRFFYAQCFEIVFCAGLVLLALALVMKKTGRSRLYQSDLICALFMLTFALPVKFSMFSSLLVWIIEIPFLLFVAVQFKERIYTYLSYALMAYVGLRSVYMLGLSDVHILGLALNARDFVYFCAGIATTISFFILRKDKKETFGLEIDSIFEHIFSAAACSYLTALLFSLVKQPWLSLALSFEGIGLLLVGLLWGLKRLRVYAYTIFVFAFFALFSQKFYAVEPLVKWTIILGNTAVFLSVYYVLKYASCVKQILAISKNEMQWALGCALILLMGTVFEYFPGRSVALVLGLWGVLFIIAGIFSKDKTQRLGGLILLGITLCRIVFVDLSGLDVIFKIITFIVLGLLFLGASFVYNRFGLDK